MASDSGMEHEDKPRTLTYEETLKQIAERYVNASEELDSMQRQIRDLTNRVGDQGRAVEKLKEALSKTVGSNIRVRNFLLGSKLVRVEFIDMGRDPKVTIENVGG